MYIFRVDQFACINMPVRLLRARAAVIVQFVYSGVVREVLGGSAGVDNPFNTFARQELGKPGCEPRLQYGLFFACSKAISICIRWPLATRVGKCDHKHTSHANGGRLCLPDCCAGCP